MFESLPPFAREQFEATFTRVRDQDVPDPAPRQDAAPTSPPARPESVPAFVVVWEWQR